MAGEKKSSLGFERKETDFQSRQNKQQHHHQQLQPEKKEDANKVNMI